MTKAEMEAHKADPQLARKYTYEEIPTKEPKSPPKEAEAKD